MVEVASHLMEQYAQDAGCMARLLSPEGKKDPPLEAYLRKAIAARHRFPALNLEARVLPLGPPSLHFPLPFSPH